jgi:hypothetical protein
MFPETATSSVKKCLLSNYKTNSTAVLHRVWLMRLAVCMVVTDPVNLKVSALRFVEDYEGALAILTEMTYFAHERATPLSGNSSQLSGAYADILSSCELSRVLLLLLLQAST